MPYFVVLVHGEGKIKRAGLFGEDSTGYIKGFVTTCIFKATNADEARSVALLKIDKRWRNGEYARFVEGGISLNVEEVSEINGMRFYSAKIVNALKLGGVLNTIPEKGHSFYSE